MDERLRRFARENRRGPSEPEVRLWRSLSRSQLGGLKFRRQHVRDGRIFDFFCPALNLAIEVDGWTHDPGIDASRDAGSEDVVVLRFSNTDVMQNLEGVLATIHATATGLAPRWKRAPHPNPSPEGEGL